MHDYVIYNSTSVTGPLEVLSPPYQVLRNAEKYRRTKD